MLNCSCCYIQNVLNNAVHEQALSSASLLDRLSPETKTQVISKKVQASDDSKILTDRQLI